MSQKMWITYPRMPEDDLKLILEYIGSVAVLGMAPYNFLDTDINQIPSFLLRLLLLKSPDSVPVYGMSRKAMLHMGLGIRSDRL